MLHGSIWVAVWIPFRRLILHRGNDDTTLDGLSLLRVLLTDDPLRNKASEREVVPQELTSTRSSMP